MACLLSCVQVILDQGLEQDPLHGQCKLPEAEAVRVLRRLVQEGVLAEHTIQVGAAKYAR